MKPFKNIETQNLKILLFIARAFAYLGGLLVLVTSFMALMVLASSGKAISIVFMLLPTAFLLLFASGVSAAIVSIEENYRKRTEHLLRSETP